VNPLTGSGFRGKVLASLQHAAKQIFDDDGDGEVGTYAHK